MDCALTRQGNSDLTSVFWEQWTEYQDQLYRCCLKLMNSNPTDAEDALSQAMLKAWEKIQKYAGKIANFKAWLYKLTRNLCIDLIRKRYRGAVGVDDIEWVGDSGEMGVASAVELPEQVLEKDEKSSEIRRAIADLPETLRETFILHFYQELTHTEIAARQGISYDNVSRRIYLAKKQLKEKLSSYFLGTGENVSVTAGYSRKLSTQRKYGEKQQRSDWEERKGLETGTKQERPTFDRHSISLSPQLPLQGGARGGFPLQEEVVEVEKSEFVDGCVELADNVGLTIQEREIVLVEVESDRLVEAEKQESLESAVESGEQVDRKIQETATELTEVGCVEVVEVEKDGCVESLVESYQIRRITISKSLQRSRSGRKESQELRRLFPMVAMTNVQVDFLSKDNRHLQKINNFIQPFLGTGSKSSQKNLFLYDPLSEKICSLLSVTCCLSTASICYQKKYFACCLSREQTRWLRPYVMWRSLTGDNTKSGLMSRLMGEMKLFLDVRSLLKDIQWMWDRSLMDTGG